MLAPSTIDQGAHLYFKLGKINKADGEIMQKLRYLRWLTTLWILALVGLFPVMALAEKVSKPGAYSGYADPIYDGWTRSSQYVSVSDGTRLAMDIFRPTNGGDLVTTPLPIIFIFTPYGRGAHILNANGDPITGLNGNPIAIYTPVGSYALRGGLVSLIQYGYVIACADVRGLGASYGSRATGNDRTEARDAYDLVEWLGTREFCDGQVAMWGASYFGQTVLSAIETMPPHLKAAYFGVTNWNFYDAWSRGGITRGSAGEVAPDPYTEVKQAVPVDGDVDGDGDGYPDQLWEAVNEHLENGAFTELLKQLPYRDSLSELYEDGTSPYWEESSPSNYLAQIEQGGVPAYVFGAWYDFLRRDTVMTFANWPNPVKMLITQGVHGDSIAMPNQLNQLVEVHRFFDYWLKGIDNGVMDEPPVYYVTVETPITRRITPNRRAPHVNSEQFATQWPPHNARKVDFYLHQGPSDSAPSVNDGQLLLKAPASKADMDDYQADYTVTTDLEPVVGSPVPSGAEFDQKGLTYTTAPLTAEVKINGLPQMTLWVSSDTRDADFIVILEDVDSDGNSFYVSDGRLRASLRKVNDPPYAFLGLPWHRAYAEDESKLTPGEPVKLEMTMMPTSYVFGRGHRIRLAVVCSLGKVFNLDPETDEDAPTWVSVHRDKTHSSCITLPIARHSNVCRGSLKIDTDNLQYQGTAALYLGADAVYIGYEDQWIKWDSVQYEEKPLAEKYTCEGELGQLTVTVESNLIRSSSVTAKGPGVAFEGRVIP